MSSCHPADAGLQVMLAEKLLDFGAVVVTPGQRRQSEIITALAFGYLDTAEALAPLSASNATPASALSTMPIATGALLRLD